LKHELRRRTASPQTRELKTASKAGIHLHIFAIHIPHFQNPFSAPPTAPAHMHYGVLSNHRFTPLVMPAQVATVAAKKTQEGFKHYEKHLIFQGKVDEYYFFCIYYQ